MSVPHHIKWLLEDNLLPTEIGGHTEKIQFPYPPEVGIGYSEHIELFDGIKIIKDVHKFNILSCPEKIFLGKFHAQYPSSIFAIHTVHQGCIEVTSVNGHLKRIPGVTAFGRLQSFEIGQTLCTKENISLSVLQAPENTLYKLLGGETADKLFENLDLFEEGDFIEVGVPQTISLKLEQCVPDHLEGQMRALYGQSIFLQYLLELNLYISSTERFTNLKNNDCFHVESLHHELLQVTANIPNLIDLARKYNVSPEKLNKVFLRQYKESIYSFLTKQRLEQAYIALTNSRVPIKTLAHKLGYSHANHFSTAFKRRYGITPGSLRK